MHKSPAGRRALFAIVRNITILHPTSLWYDPSDHDQPVLHRRPLAWHGIIEADCATNAFPLLHVMTALHTAGLSNRDVAAWVPRVGLGLD